MNIVFVSFKTLARTDTSTFLLKSSFITTAGTLLITFPSLAKPETCAIRSN